MSTFENDPELNGKYLGTISSDFVKISEYVKEASYQIRKRGFSDFPVFPISKGGTIIGSLLYKKEDLGLEWNYYVTYLEDFVQQKIIKKEKSDDFKSVYKNPDEFCCLFVIDKEFTNFLFIPYPED